MSLGYNTAIFKNMSEECAASALFPEDGGGRVLQDTDNYLPHYTVSHSGKVIFTLTARTSNLT